MASFVSSVTFSFGSDVRVTLPESLLACPPAGGITFDSFTDSAFVTLGGPTPAEAAAFSPPQRRGRAAMRPFERPAARRTARTPTRPVPVLVQPVRPVAKRLMPRLLPVPLVRPTVRRQVPTALVAQVAPAPQHRQPIAVVPPVRLAIRRRAPVTPIAQVALAPQRQQPAAIVTPAVPVEVPRIRVSPPTSTRKRGAQIEVPSPSSGWVSVFARLSHSETTWQTPALPVVPIPPALPGALTQRIRNIIRLALGRGPVSRERLL
ncbi:hypothetical protein KFK09_024037 [Dendrobium nobile]|uniref:Uncharacterized protein n=1 Tax=Dendrobium nobile TaxID=94219 RepID=A0A8T3ACM9_DENNO|nr:hypothetical protein KFK09_024037 [Dendrobium nobile]